MILRSFCTTTLAAISLSLFAAYPRLPAAQAQPSISWPAKPAATPLSPPAASVGSASTEELSEESPRAALLRYLELCERGDYAEASRYLDLPANAPQPGPVLARWLKAVLDRYADIDPSKVSNNSNGNTADGLPSYVEEIAKIPNPKGGLESVRMVRRQLNGEATWQFSRRTVAQVPEWYAALKEHYILEKLPKILLRTGPAQLRYWQWLALPLFLLLSFVLGFVLHRLMRIGIRHMVHRTGLQAALLLRLGGPAILGWTLLSFMLLLPFLRLYPPAQRLFDGLLRSGALVTLLWALLRLLDVVGERISASAWAVQRPTTRALIPLWRRLLKAVLWVLVLIFALAALGYPVASLLAGLGIGGLVVALAAQKTVENLFGTFSIGTDQPFREGDFIRVDKLLGTVEQIGLRSTRIRTLERTLVSIPNGKLADAQVESFTPRDRIRLAQDLGLSYAATAAQITAVLSGIEAALRAHPKIWPSDLYVRLKLLGEYALIIEIAAFFQTTDWDEFTRIRQELLLRFMEIIEANGVTLAMPAPLLQLAYGDRLQTSHASGR